MTTPAPPEATTSLNEPSTLGDLRAAPAGPGHSGDDVVSAGQEAAPAGPARPTAPTVLLVSSLVGVVLGWVAVVTILGCALSGTVRASSGAAQAVSVTLLSVSAVWLTGVAGWLAWGSVAQLRARR